jgi:hypothetical protein
LAFETAAIVRIYGEIDRKVNVEPARRIDVAQFLSPYYLNPTLHWYDDYREWLGETREDEQNPFPGLVPALTHLGENENRDILPRQRARRMFAIAVLVSAFPEMKKDGELRTLATNALRAPEGTAEPEDGAEHVYALLAGIEPVRIAGVDVVPGTQPWWNEMVAPYKAHDEVTVIGMQSMPCAGRWVRVPGIDGPVDAVRTEHEPEGIGLKQATKFLDPVHWPDCSDFWCNMDPLEGPAAGQGRYREVVSTRCSDGPRPDFVLPDFWAETELLFNFMWIPEKDGAEAAVANYRLVPDPRKNDGRIVLDEGTLVLATMQDPDKLLVTTTKRVRFSREFVPGAIAVVACAFGYGDLSNGMMERAARGGGSKFPGVAVNGAPAAAGARAGGRRGGSGQGAAGGFVQEGADIAIRAIRDWANLLETVGGAGKQGTPTRRRRPGG